MPTMLGTTPVTAQRNNPSGGSGLFVAFGTLTSERRSVGPDPPVARGDPGHAADTSDFYKKTRPYGR
jgi:hypothetical protein